MGEKLHGITCQRNPRFRCNKAASYRLSYGMTRSEDVQGKKKGPSLVRIIRGKLEGGRGENLKIYCIRIRGGDSVLGITTGYCRRSGDRIPVEAKFFRTRPDRPWGPPSLLYDGYRVFPRIKRPGRGVNHPHLSRVQVKERVEVYCYAPSGPSWPVLG